MGKPRKYFVTDCHLKPHFHDPSQLATLCIGKNLLYLKGDTDLVALMPADEIIALKHRKESFLEAFLTENLELTHLLIQSNKSNNLIQKFCIKHFITMYVKAPIIFRSFEL